MWCHMYSAIYCVYCVLRVVQKYLLSLTVCSLVSNGIFALFGMHDMRTINTLRSFTQALHLPYVTPSLAVNNSIPNMSYMLYMRPLHTQAIMDVIKHYRWTVLYYLYNSEDGNIDINNIIVKIVMISIVVGVEPCGITMVTSITTPVAQGLHNARLPTRVDVSNDVILFGNHTPQ